MIEAHHVLTPIILIAPESRQRLDAGKVVAVLPVSARVLIRKPGALEAQDGKRFLGNMDGVCAVNLFPAWFFHIMVMVNRLIHTLTD